MGGVLDAGIELSASSQAGGLPNIVIENLEATTTEAFKQDKNMSLVRYEGVDKPILPRSSKTNTWIMGNQVTDLNGTVFKTGGNHRRTTQVPAGLKSGSKGDIFERSKPQYNNGEQVVNVIGWGVKNDGSGDQANSINAVLKTFNGMVVFFPAGVYMVSDTVYVPVGTKMVGEGWSQIMGFGRNFADEQNPRPIVKLV